MDIEHASVVVDQLKAARVPMKEFRASSEIKPRSASQEIDMAAQKKHLKQLFFSLKKQGHCDQTIFSILYSNFIKNEKFDDTTLFSEEKLRLYEARLASPCKPKKFTTIKGRFDFPSQDERVNYFNRPAGLDESLMRPVLDANMSKLITCKPDHDAPDEKFSYFRALKQINKMELLLKEPPILLYNIPACQCSDLTSYRCHHCQKVIKEFYPCHTCDVCVFCNIECYLVALDLYHRFECYALQRHMFSTNLMMAMRLMLIGMQTDIFNQKVVPKAKWLKYHSNCSYDRVMSSHRDYIQDPHIREAAKNRQISSKLTAYTKYYQQVKNYYELKKLPVNWELMGDIDNLFVDVLRIVGYLSHSTDLFQHLLKCPWRPDHAGIFDLQMYAGGMMLRHYGEVLCNALAIPNVAMRPKQMEEVEDGCTFVIGTGLGRFQHSCEPNAAFFLYNNEVILRAFQDIEKNGKIFINYFGIEDAIDSHVRQDLIQKMYFKCGCSKCNTMDYEDILGLTAFKCPKCDLPLYGDSDNLQLQCFTCDDFFNSKPFLEKESQIKAILEKAVKVADFRKAEKLCNEIFKPYNPQFDRIYRSLHQTYVKIHDPVNTQTYFKKYMRLSTYTSPTGMSKSTAKYNYYFLQYFLDMCRTEKFYDSSVMNMLTHALSDIRQVYTFYYNIEQVSMVTDLISSINPLIQVPLSSINRKNLGTPVIKISK